MTKKKTIITSLGLFAAAALIGVGGALALNSIPEKADAIAEGEDGYYHIANVEDYLQIFNNAGTHTAHNIKLDADIDLSGVTLPGNRGMAGDFTGEFDGQGHTIYGFPAKGDYYLFNNVNGGDIKNVTVEAVSDTEVRSAAIFAYQIFGTEKNPAELTNVTGILAGAALYSDAIFMRQAGNYITLTDCSAHFVGTVDDNSLIWWEGASSNYETNNFVYTNTNASGTSLGQNGIKDIPESATLASNVQYALAPEKEIKLTAGVPYEVSAMGLGLSETGTATWSVEEGAPIAISNQSTGGATITASQAIDESVDLTVTYQDGDATASATMKVTALAASDVSAVQIVAPEGSEEIEQEETITLTATITGTIYKSVEWTASSDNVEIAQSPDDPLSATVKGLTPSDVGTTITVNVKTASSTVSDTIDIKVTEPIGFYFNILYPANSSVDKRYNGLAVVARTGKPDIGAPGQNLTINGTSLATINYEGREYNLRRAFIPTARYDIIGDATASIQLASVGDDGSINNGWWGALTSISRFYNQETQTYRNAYVTYVWNPDLAGGNGDWNQDKDSTVELSQAHADAFDYMFEHFYNVREAGEVGGVQYDDSICGILDDAEKLDAILTGYEALTDDAKAVLDTVKDPLASDPESTNTISDTIAMLISESNAASGKYAANALNPTSGFNTNAVIVLVTFGAAALLLTSYFIVKRKRQAK